MSDSQSSEEQEVKVSLEQGAKLKDILAKGQQIAPFYDEETLIQVYKEYFSSEAVFYNQLEIIAKSRISQNEESNNGWIVFKKGEKTLPIKERQTVSKPTRARYNFLEDTKLIERALRFKREDYSKQRQDHQPTDTRQYRQKIQNPEPQNEPRRKYQQKKQIEDQQDSQKRIKYKEKTIQQENKDQVVKSKNVQKIAIIQPTPQITSSEKISSKQASQQIQTKPIHNPPNEPKLPKYPQKKQKYVQKKIQKNAEDYKITSSSQVPKQITTPESPETKPQNIKYKQGHVQNNKQNKQKDTKTLYKPKEQTLLKDQYKSVVTSKLETKKEDKVQKQSEKIQPVVSQPPKNIIHTDTQPTLVNQTSVLKQSVDPEQILRQFANSCKQNSYILPYIKPNSKLQKVSYIRYPNGTMKDITVREVYDQNN